MSILVTGGAGFIAPFLMRSLLKRGETVVAMDLNYDPSTSIRELMTPEEMDQIVKLRVNVADPVSFYRAIKEHKVRRIVHLAMVSGPAEGDPWRSVEVNVFGTLTSFEAARMFDIDRVVFASSAQVFGTHTRRAEQFGQVPIMDGDPHMPYNVYTAVKSLDEYLGGHYTRKFGIDARGLRPIGVFGPGRRGGGRGAVMTAMLKAAAFGKPFTLPNGELAIPLSYVEDVARAFEVALYYDGKELTGRTVNIGAESTTHRQLAEIVRRVAPGTSIEVTPGDDGNPVTLPVDNSTLRNATGFGLDIGLEEGIRRTIEFFRRTQG